MAEEILINSEIKADSEKHYKIGYTTGTFDLFHAGHLNILKEAKKRCDYLIVGVHSDEWVFQSKNRYPVICFEDRKAILESLKYVDKVIMNDTHEKGQVWKKYKFNAHFSGSDYMGSATYKKFARQYEEAGGDVDLVFIKYSEKASSTDIKNAILAGKTLNQYLQENKEN